MSPTMDGAVGLEHLEPADLVLVVAEDLQQHLAAGSRREENIVLIEQRGIIRDQITRLVGLELKAAAERARPAPQIASAGVR